MSKKPTRHVSKRPEWPAVLERAAELAAQGASRYHASRIIASEFPISDKSFVDAAKRGEVPAYPTDDPKRAEAWARDLTRYLAAPCPNCEGTEYYTSDRRCTACEAEYQRFYQRAPTS